ncbi:MAG: uncharacterized protein AEth_01888 [Candidatus Argoarchaeum ethanivorans]|uniref:DUF460 domain-containing protein n=1 Tax=Candidatus Argoarchaeum ethanivorans TaxID=2608793 RepID=A0A8B3RZZ4_9EURY|nr:MAG: uncharacterized protein AEth_01888 [Candidatus Argoarchaeum ethanivorans]
MLELASTIFGVDISKGSPKGRTPPLYAVVILKNTGVEKLRMLSKYKLLKLIHEYKPDIIATDNIYELASDRKELTSDLQKLPSSTRIVQVTGGEHKGSLPGIAKEYGISINRFDPVDEAYACAMLAQIGVGDVLEAFENATKITVTRARSLGRGGWSQNRYRRKVHGTVREKTRDIEAYLKEYALTHHASYTLKVVRGYGGYSRGEFIIQVPKDKLQIHGGHYGDAQVEVKSIEKDRFKFKPLTKPKHPYIIIGIDPGTTTAVAALKLDGERLYLGSSRTTSTADTIETLSNLGRPLVIATDVNPIPHGVERIRRSFSAVPFIPPESLSVEEKIELTQDTLYANTHERDALAAALCAYKKYKNKFVQIERKLSNYANSDEIKAKVVKGESIDAALMQYTASKPKTIRVKKTVKFRVRDETAATRQKEEEQLSILKEYIDDLQKQITNKDLEIKTLHNKLKTLRTKEYKKLKRDKEIQIRSKKIKYLSIEVQRKEDKIRELRDRNSRIRQMRRLEMTGYATPVKIVESFTRDSIQQTKDASGIKKGDVLLIMDASGGGTATANILKQLQVKAVATYSEMSHVAEQQLFINNIPVFSAVQLNIKRENEFAIATTEDITQAITEWKKNAEKYRYNQKREWLQQLIKEYQGKRKKELKKQGGGNGKWCGESISSTSMHKDTGK